ncbi:MAG: hypothetical protein GY702_02185 [Desulfobulbaceae bacterium]|nr:hypothetical protein [Desulfobulbaceae bacterium]
MKDGIIVKQHQTVKLKLAEWRITLTMDDPSPQMISFLKEEIQVFRRLLTRVPDTLSHVARKTYWLQELDRADRWFQSLCPRNRRAVLGIIGRLSKELFGTATEEDVENLKTKIIENRNAIEKVVNFDEELLTLVNVTQEQVTRNRHTINDIINATSEMYGQLIAITTKSQFVLHGLTTYNVIGEKMDLIWKHLDELQRIKDERGNIKIALEQGRLDEHLLPTVTLKQILNRIDLAGIEFIKPLEWYYSNCRILPLWEKDFLAYIVYLPLVESKVYEGSYIQTFPVPLPNSTTSAQLQADGLVALSTTGRVLHLRQCVGQHPIVCDPAPERKDGPSTYSCAQSLIMKASDVHKRCSVEVRNLPEGLIFKTIPNHMIIVTWGEEITEQCVSGVQRVHLDPGTYQISWSGKCFLTTAYWTIAGVVMKNENATLHLGWNSWTLANFDLPKIIGKLNTTISLPDKLTDPKLISLHLPLSPSFTPFIHNNHTYYIFLILCLIPAGIGLYYVIRMKRKNVDRMYGRPARMIEMNESNDGKSRDVHSTPEPFKLKIATSPSVHNGGESGVD